MSLVEIDGSLENGRIKTTQNISEISKQVINGNIVILKNVFKLDFLLDFRKKVIRWSQSVPPIQPKLEKNDDYLKNNHHRIDDNPPQSKTPHMSHFFNFLKPDNLPEYLSNPATQIFSVLRDLQNEVSGTNGDFFSTSNMKMRPQVIQYPVGGGFFGEHAHPFEPQKIGLITGLSRKGIDYKTGSTTFKTPLGFVDTTEHNIGNITLFRYDFPHAVTKVDPDEVLDWNSEKGRWTLILPFY